MSEKKWADIALAEAVQKIASHVQNFYPDFPAPQSTGYIYEKTPNVEWTPGFYTGMLMIGYQYSMDEELAQYIKKYIDSFQKRIEERIATQTHDLGFLYTLSCVAAYKVFGWANARRAALKAADCLLERWKPKGEFIQAWGSINDPDCYRLIIDSLLNMPLLFWAAEETGNKLYYELAHKHAQTCASVIMRPDGTTFHTFYFDADTGSPLRGATHQGFSDESCWARGQAWGIYGFALCYKYTKDNMFLEPYKRITDYFLSHLANDNVPYWDLYFTSGQEPRDTSAAAIAVCGILEMSKHIQHQQHIDRASQILETLSRKYTTKNILNSNGLLTDGMYSRPRGHNPECNIWGDYFYMEALNRHIYRRWEPYW